MPSRLLRGIARQILNEQGSRADDAHVAFQDIHEFWQLIEAIAPKEMAEGRNPLGVPSADSHPITRHHSSEFDKLEDRFIPPRPCLSKQHRATHANADRCGDRRKNRRKHYQKHTRYRDVKDTLED